MQNTTMDFETARELLLASVEPVGTEKAPLSRCAWRVLAQDLTAVDNVPPFDRSPYDGYAFRAQDSLNPPVTLRVLEEIAAGGVSHMPVTAGTAVKILTGAPIPPGADAVVKYEDTVFTADTVTLSAAARPGQNIVRAGEDVKAGQVLAWAGDVIDPGVLGVLAAQGVAEPRIYQQPRVGVISTGNEVVEADQPLAPGKIRNTNRYTLEAALTALGCQPVFLGIAGDTAEAVCTLMQEGIRDCHAVVLTGGVSVGDYDMTPAALKMLGAETLVRNVRLKPGGACAYARKDGRLLCGLSGNPASAMTNFYAVALPALNRLAGRRQAYPPEIRVTLAADFGKKSPSTRLLRGRLDLSGGAARLLLPSEQGNVVLSSLIGCDAMAVVPAGSGPLKAGTVLKGFRL